MSKVIAIVDSETGALVDVAGNPREGARYRRFVKRMMSIGVNPVVLDYGANGGTKLEVSKGGNDGEEIVLKAKTVKITGKNLIVDGKTLDEIISAGGTGSIFDDIREGNGISVSQEPDPEDPEKTILVISLSEEVGTSLDRIGQALSEMDVDDFVKKEDLAEVIDGVSFDQDDTLDMVKSKLNFMVNKISEFIGTDSSPSEEETT